MLGERSVILAIMGVYSGHTHTFLYIRTPFVAHITVRLVCNNNNHFKRIVCEYWWLCAHFLHTLASWHIIIYLIIEIF